MDGDLSLDVLLARRELVDIRPSEYRAIAVGLIEHGHDHPRLHELAWEGPSTIFESAHLLDEAVAQLGLAMPSRPDAVEILLHHYASRIVEGKSIPHSELQGMMRSVYWPEVSSHEAREFVGDSHDIQHLVGAYWGYDDLLESPDVVGFNGHFGQQAILAFDAHVRRHATEWLTKHPSPPRFYDEGGSRMA